MTKTLCFCASLMTVSSFCSPLVSLLIEVVPLLMSWNQVPFTGIEVTSEPDQVRVGGK